MWTRSELTISPLDKGFSRLEQTATPPEIVALGWNLLEEDVSLPAAVLSASRLEHNLQWMQRFVAAYGVLLAPHGKTTMAPALFRRQIDAGAWGITLATAQQTRVAYAHGVRRVLMANQLVGKSNMAVIADLLTDASFEFFCLVDSPQQVDLLARFFAARNQQIQVLVEIGIRGGRTGVRDDAGLQAVLDALTAAKEHVLLAGVEVYEGILQDEGAIRALLRRTLAIATDLADKGQFARTPPVLTGAGSAWYDVVAEEFAGIDRAIPVNIVLRPGCYLTHDVGVYRDAQRAIVTRNPIARQMAASLLPALQVWAHVQSIPEAGTAIIALGKRDAAFDAGLPEPSTYFRPGHEAPRTAPSHWRVTRMMDQHAFLEIREGDDIQIGDMIAFDISHPCLTFDKWRQLLVLDEDYRVIDVIQTYF